jgi:hypothetical protein
MRDEDTSITYNRDNVLFDHTPIPLVYRRHKAKKQALDLKTK